MSRYREGDDDWREPEAILAQGRWEHNARQVLKSKRGRKALAEIRAALMALPERRLVSGAMCTAGTVDERLPEFSAEDAAMARAESAALTEWCGYPPNPQWEQSAVDMARDDRDEDRRKLAEKQDEQGCGVCVNGALLWHRKVLAGMEPDEAFLSLPLVIGLSDEEGDPLAETADITAAEAGIARTLAWELAYRNDETYGSKTPEERYTAFLEWVDAELATEGASS
jgi:hypothetical protein